jgi:hypothetical protein
LADVAAAPAPIAAPSQLAPRLDRGADVAAGPRFVLERLGDDFAQIVGIGNDDDEHKTLAALAELPRRF